MATTTPNFGWPVPTSTDLVKDGATAIEALGDGVDASLVDLKGGTTGQVLAKTSGTDLDFTWVTTDDANAIQNAIVDAKGDLIAATAADTPARLAVGTDYGFLQAISAQSTGLLWNNATWTSYTPTVDASGGSGFTMSGVGYYTRIGKLCILNYTATVTTNGTGSGKIRMTLPFTARFVTNYASGTFRENGLTGKMGVAFLSTSGIVSMSLYDDVYPGGTGASLQGFLVYEVA